MKKIIIIISILIPVSLVIISCLFFFVIGNPIRREMSKYVATQSMVLFSKEVPDIKRVKYNFKAKEYIVFFKQDCENPAILGIVYERDGENGLYTNFYTINNEIREELP